MSDQQLLFYFLKEDSVQMMSKIFLLTNAIYATWCFAWMKHIYIAYYN